jgi:leader peptidase (prepilin peptidase)/N-methyltransferase
VSAETLDLMVVCGALFLGASIGSFLNVVVARVPAGLSVVKPRSRCPRCLAPIAWYDNVPVLSWLLLRARCRACGAAISARYPLVEALGAAAALLALRRHGIGAAAAAELGFAAVMLALAFIDLDTWLLPHALTLPLLGAGLLASALGIEGAPAPLQAALGAGVGFAVFAAISVAGEWVFKREALGFGDVWLLAGIGAWLGVKALLPVVLLSSLQGSAVGLVLASMGKLPRGEEAAPAEADARSTKSDAGAAPDGDEEDDWTPPRNSVPFGPFLVAGALEWLYAGDLIARLVPTLELFRG